MPTFLKIIERFTISWLVKYLKVLIYKGYVYCVCSAICMYCEMANPTSEHIHPLVGRACRISKFHPQECLEVNYCRWKEA